MRCSIYGTIRAKYKIFKTDEFEGRLEREPAKSRVQVATRLEKIQEEGHFGDHKTVRKHIAELRWNNGRRVYYSLIPERKILLLLGGNKNGQSKDITQAEKIHKDWIYD